MEENIQKILNEKDENVVQFNVTNTTNQNQYVDLFNSASLTPVATSLVYSNPQNSVYTLINCNPPFSVAQYTAISSANFLYVTTGGDNLILVYDLNNNNVLVTTITLTAFSNLAYMQYNPINNILYVADAPFGAIQLIDCNTNSVILAIGGMGIPFIMTLNTNNNTLYVTDSGGTIKVIDCNINATISTIILFSNYLSFNSINNVVYATDIFGTNDITIIDCLTNTITGTITLSFPSQTTYNPANNLLYVVNNSNTEIAVIDCSTNTLLSSTPPPVLFGTLGIGILDYSQNQIYFQVSSGDVVLYDCNTNTFLSYLTAVCSGSMGFSSFSAFNNSIYFADVFNVTINALTTIGITATPFYVTGSSNYNSFVNNLNNEPILIQMIRLLVQNQNQLTNELQLTTIDSNGNQIFMPNFPINEVSAYQQQGNIGEVPFKDIIFDGRTYINQYQLNPNESLSFEIYYKQLDLTTATATFPIFFKPKIQLKEYIRKDYNNYDVEM
jgi:DNA-binding beta-propeller fold protein YncE